MDEHTKAKDCAVDRVNGFHVQAASVIPDHWLTYREGCNNIEFNTENIRGENMRLMIMPAVY